MELEQMAEQLAGAFEALEMSWEGYDVVPVPPEDFQVAVAAIIDYLDGVEGPAVMELPNAHIKVERDAEGSHRVWMDLGSIDIDDA